VPEDVTASDAVALRHKCDGLIPRIAEGDDQAFAELYDLTAPAVFGLAKRVLRHVEHAEEVAQEVLLEVWQQAARYDPKRGSALAWMMTMTHRRAVDRVRAVQASSGREQRVGQQTQSIPHDAVAEEVEARLEAEEVRDCIEELTDIQRQSVTLAYFGGYTYPEVAALLRAPLGTIKTRMRDGLIRLRDCLGVST
jgi:RNA polymerase sigma-70 factor (ECF subfamily)